MNETEMSNGESSAPEPRVSIGIIARNEAPTLGAMLESVFRQSLFRHLRDRRQSAEILCVANGCTDGTADAASSVFARERHSHPFATAFTCRAIDLQEPGKINAWNQFVHSFSAPTAEFLFLADADIRLAGPDTLWNMLQALERDPEAHVAVDQPCKDFKSQSRRVPGRGLSLAASRLTVSTPAQLCGQLYCIRATVARRILLPRHLTACDDGFIKALVCTDFLTRPLKLRRIVLAPDAAHTFQPYTSLREILQNQKRQAIGQTMVHILADRCLNRLGDPFRGRPEEWIRQQEHANPAWLRHLIAEHLRHTHFWRLYPGLLSSRFRALRSLGFFRKLTCLPAAMAGSALALISSFRACRFLKKGQTEFWPEVRRRAPARRPESGQPEALPLNRLNEQPE